MKASKLWTISTMACVLSILVYLPALNNGFVNWDDDVYIYENQDLQSSGTDFIKFAFNSTKLGNWNPLTWFSYYIDHALWGLDPTGYHLTNILLHSFNTLIVVFIAGWMFTFVYGFPDEKAIAGTVLTGIIFALHPLHVESVAWISERKDVLYAFFWLLSVLFYFKYTSAAEPGRKRLYYSACLFLFALSLSSKPMAVTLPVVLLILDIYPLRRLDLKKRFVKTALLEKLPFYLLSLIFSLIAVSSQDKGGAMEAMNYLTSWERSWTALKALCFYLLKTVWPVHLVPLYPLKIDVSPMEPEYMASFLIVVCITAACITLRKRFPVLLAAWSFYVVTLLPVIGIIQVGAQEAADRYMYMAILGPVMVLAAMSAMVWGMGKKARTTLAAMTLIIAVILSVLTVKQISVWKDSITLWEYVTAKEPEATKAHFNLGNSYKDKGDILRAQKAWRRTVEVEPGHSLALNQLGNVYFIAGKLPEAKKYYKAAVKSDSKHAEAIYNLALTLEKLHETEGALLNYELFLETAPDEYDHLGPGVMRKISLLRSGNK